jgi:peptidoglycan hydrolase-like protein with peptidoglycan-binding domain
MFYHFECARMRTEMALQSKLFKSDAKLQACLTNDASHLTAGSQGEHVAKIQRAIDALGDRVIDPNEIAAKTYGPSTAAAVLAYKKARNIVNLTYQKEADNIVGKMTIAQLDKDMLRLENPPVVAGSTCGWKDQKLG